MNAQGHIESKELCLHQNTPGKSQTLLPCGTILRQADPTSTVTFIHIYSSLSLLHTSQCFSLLLVFFLQINVLVSLQTEVTQLSGAFLQVFDFELAQEEMETLLGFKKRYRICALSE